MHRSSQRNPKSSLLQFDLTFEYGTGADHSIFDVYLNGNFYNSYNGYSASPGSQQVTIALKGDGLVLFEMRNRPEQSPSSAGYKMRFKSLATTSRLLHRTIDYSYDALSRLLQADYNNGTVHTYGFDVAGNLVNINGVTRTYNEANQISNTGFVFDDNGNMTSDGTNSYTWDRANRLVQMGTTTYKYDGNNNRIQQNALSYILDMQPGLTKVIGDSDGNRYVHSLRGIHAMENASGDWLYAGQDGLGNVRAEINASGIVQSKQDYDPFLTPMNAIGTSQMPFGATGEYTDDNDLLYLRARYMSPAMGMFISLDPFEGLHNRPMSLNGYSWVEGNPVMRVDPSGMTCICEQFINSGDIRIYAACIANPAMFYSVPSLLDPATDHYAAAANEASVVISWGNWDSGCPNSSLCCETSLDVCNTSSSHWGASSGMATLSNHPVLGIWTHAHLEGPADTPSVNKTRLRAGVGAGGRDWMQFQGIRGRLTIPLATFDYDPTYSSIRGILIVPDPTLSVAHITLRELERIGTPVRADISAHSTGLSFTEPLLQAYVVGATPSGRTARSNFAFVLRKIQKAVNPWGVNGYEFGDDRAVAGDSGSGIFKLVGSTVVLVGVHGGNLGSGLDMFTPIGL